MAEQLASVPRGTVFARRQSSSSEPAALIVDTNHRGSGDQDSAVGNISNSMAKKGDAATLLPLHNTHHASNGGKEGSNSLQHRVSANSGNSNDLVDLHSALESPSKLHDLQGPQSTQRSMFGLVLLVILYIMQGVPVGLTLGSVPFILRTKVSYTEIGIFSLASYPYSLKLLWSPIVDSVFFRRIGRRKSWLLPMQLSIAVLMFSFADSAERWLDEGDIENITLLFFVLVLLTATHDIAVDGWALTLLSKEYLNLSTSCQTLGTNIGYFTSFTVFLALSDPDFCNSHIRTSPKEQAILPLSKYLRIWGTAYVLLAVALIFLVKERYDGVHHFSYGFYMPNQIGTRSSGPLPSTSASDSEKEKDRALGGSGTIGVRGMYGKLWTVMRLPHMRELAMMLLMCKVGSITAETVGAFKLMDKGVSRESISLIVVLAFPFEIAFTLIAGRLSQRGKPLVAWTLGYRLRLLFAFLTTVLVLHFPILGAHHVEDAVLHYVFIGLATIGSSFANTLMFVAQGSFFSRISDASMGGTYLTLLNTVANFGAAWPKFLVFAAIDFFTFQRCEGTDLSEPPMCPVRTGELRMNEGGCELAGGECRTLMDGFYLLSFGLIIAGIRLGSVFNRKAEELETAKEDTWSV
mmetsp:Transcript_2966/g.10708  ORF Transcript_2966/g.10708 Transcript_2966/m.10708 type:complete len:634 (+) Transcript_2966:178-2079(+)